MTGFSFPCEDCILDDGGGNWDGVGGGNWDDDGGGNWDDSSELRIMCRHSLVETAL